MPSPPRTLRRSPPRRALQERSESHSNEVLLPSLRMLADSKTPIYRTSPFPTQASQVLSPKGRGADWRFEDEVDISDDDDSEKELAPAPLHIARDNVGQNAVSGTGTVLPDAPDSVENTASSSLDAPHDPMAWNQYYSDRPISDEIIELPSLPRIGSRDGSAGTLYSSSTGLGFQDATTRGFLPSKTSENSLSSTESSGTVIRKTRDRSSRPLYSAFPPTSSSRPDSSRSYQAPWTPPKPTVNSSNEQASPASSASFAPENQRVSSTASHATFQEAVDSDADVQYPVVRPPAFSGSWAELSEDNSKRPLRLGSRSSQQKWNPHLSTVQSEYSDDRDSTSLHAQSSVVPGNRSSMLVSEASDNLNRSLPPVPAWASQRDRSDLTIRAVGNQDTNMPDQWVPTLHSSGSAFVSPSKDSNRENRRNSSPTRPVTRGSFLGIPAWARYVGNTDYKPQEGVCCRSGARLITALELITPGLLDLTPFRFPQVLPARIQPVVRRVESPDQMLILRWGSFDPELDSVRMILLLQLAILWPSLPSWSLMIRQWKSKVPPDAR